MPAGAFAADAALTLQASTNPIEPGYPAVLLQSSQAWQLPLRVSLPIPAAATQPAGLGLAVRRSDGTWRALGPVKVDTTAGLVSALLPADVDGDVTTALAATKSRANARGLQQRKLDVYNVIAYLNYYLVPGSAHVKVNDSVEFTAMVRVVETDPPCPQIDPDLPLGCLNRRHVTNAYPFTIDKAGYERYWSVNAIPGGAADVGTITMVSPARARYTAPPSKPTPDTVTVQFHSVHIKTMRTVPPMTAAVKITDEVVQSYIGSIDVRGAMVDIPNTARGTVTWTLVERLPGDLSKYEASGTVEVSTSWANCDLAVGPIPVSGTMIVYDSDRNGAGDPWAGKYWFNLEPKEVKTASVLCGSEPRKREEVPLMFSAQVVCSQDRNVAASLPRYAVDTRLQGRGTWACPEGRSEIAFDFNAK